jgi:hypothetical protein
MVSESQAVGASVSRSREEISLALRSLLQSRTKVVSFLENGELLFESRLAHVDPGAQHITLELSSNKAANKALLAQTRCILCTWLDGWRLEFVAVTPKLAATPNSPARAPAIRLDFPEVLSRWKRAHERAAPEHKFALLCVADCEGIMPFDGQVVDISREGLGFLIHEGSITLEPGTLLKGCIIEMPGFPPYEADLEVCYSQHVVLGGGIRGVRSGCRFVELSDAVRELIDNYVRESGV